MTTPPERRRPHRRIATLLAGLLLFTASITAAQSSDPDQTFQERTRVTAIDLAIEAERRVEADDLKVLDGGEEREVVGLVDLDKAALEPWQLVVYFDLPLSSPRTLQATAAALARDAGALTALGYVELVAADPTPHTLLPPTRDKEVLDQALSRLMMRLKPTNELDALRRLAQGLPAEEGQTPVSIDAETALEGEIAVVVSQQDELLTWIAERTPGAGAKALFLIQDGFDLDPGAFYQEKVGARVDGLGARQHLSRSNADLAKTLSGYGWVTFPVAFRRLEADPEERVDDFDRYRYEAMDGVDGNSMALVPFDLKGRKKKDGKGKPGELLRAPREPLEIIAQTTSGSLIARSTGLTEALQALGKRQLLTFQASWPLDGRLRPVEVKTARRTVKSPGWIRSATPQTVAEARIRRIVAGSQDAEELEVRARWPTSAGMGDLAQLSTTVTLDPAELETLPQPPMRISLGQGSDEGGITFQHLIIHDQPHSDGIWTYTAGLEVDATNDWWVVLVENLADGTWGSRSVEPPGAAP